VHLRARRESGGVRIGWIRRSRVDGDAWEPFDIPLGEASERYALEIRDGGSLKRRIETSEPEALYSEADEIADFGAPRASLDLRVVQISASVGDGAPLSRTVIVG
jgi:hypothetical protein